MIHETIDIECDYARAGIPKPDYRPQLHTYILDNYLEMQPLKRRPAVIICPGGGYSRTSFREGEHIAIRFNALGFNAFILKYSCAPAVFPAAQLELAAAIALVRSRAKAWHVNPKKVVVAGFSAGGHLAASLGVLWNRELPTGSLAQSKSFSLSADAKGERNIRPDGMILCYPVITSGEFAHEDSFRKLLDGRFTKLKELVSLEKHVAPDTPPAFIWHTFEDTTVPVENSLMFAAALRRNKVPFELHVYQPGAHGLAAANRETLNAAGWGMQKECQNWIDMAAAWLGNL